MSVSYLAASSVIILNDTTANYSTYSYDSLATGADRILVVTVMHENAASGPSGITYDGVALTESLVSVVNGIDGFSETTRIWTLVNPATGVNDLVVSGSGGNRDGGITAAVFTGVDQTTPFGNTATNSASRGTEATTVSITKQSVDNLIVWSYCYDQGDKTIEAIADNVGLVLAFTENANTRASSFGTGYRTVGSGSVLVGASRTTGASQDNACAAIELMASAAAVESDAERSAKTSGELRDSALRAAKVEGGNTQQVETSAVVNGIASDSIERSAKVSGIIETSAERAAKVSGVADIGAERSAKVTGAATETNERDAKILGVVVSEAERSAKITGVAAPASVITIDNHTTHSPSGFANTDTIADFDCSGINSRLFVGVFYKDADSITGFTADGNAMTMRSGSQNIQSGVCGVEAWEYTIDNASFDVVSSQPSFKEIAFTAVALGGVNQATPTIGTPVLADGFNSDVSATYTGTAGNMLMVTINVQGTRTLTAPGLTVIDTFQPDSSIGACLIGYIESTGSAQTIEAAIAGGDTNWRISIVEINAASGTSATNERDAKVAGIATTNAERSALVTGADTADAERNASVAGLDTANNERDASVAGLDTANNERDASVAGQQSDNAERNAKVTGNAGSNAQRGAAVDGQETAQNDRVASVRGADSESAQRTAKTTGESILNVSRGASTTGQVAANNSRNAGVSGADSATNEHQTKVVGELLDTAERSAEVSGAAAEANQRSAKITGDGGEVIERNAKTRGLEIASNNRSVKTTGALAALAQRAAKVAGVATETAVRSATIQGSEAEQVERDARVTGQLASSQTVQAIVHGVAASSINRSAKVTGQLAVPETTNAIRSSKISGQLAARQTVQAIVHGVAIDNENRNAEIKGAINVTASRGASVTGGGRGNPYCPEDTPYTDKADKFMSKDSPFANKISPYNKKTAVYIPFDKRNC